MTHYPDRPETLTLASELATLRAEVERARARLEESEQMAYDFQTDRDALRARLEALETAAQAVVRNSVADTNLIAEWNDDFLVRAVDIRALSAAASTRATAGVPDAGGAETDLDQSLELLLKEIYGDYNNIVGFEKIREFIVKLAAQRAAPLPEAVTRVVLDALTVSGMPFVGVDRPSFGPFFCAWCGGQEPEHKDGCKYVIALAALPHQARGEGETG